MPHPYQPGEIRPLPLSKEELQQIAQRVSAAMIIEYGEPGAAFLYRSGPLGAAFARLTYLEICKILEAQQ